MNEPTFYKDKITDEVWSIHPGDIYFLNNKGIKRLEPNNLVLMSKLIAIDFDGVVHSYTSKWTGATSISDPPVEGAFNFIRDLLDAGLQVAIFSTRNVEPGAIDSMKAWLFQYGLDQILVDKIQFPTSKPTLASVFIDDRAYLFEGSFPSVEYLKSFKPWNKR